MPGDLPMRLREVLEPLVRRVVAGDFEGLSRDGLTAHPESDLGLWVRLYPADLTEVPDAGWALADYTRFDDLAGWWIVLPLWTEQEGRSDLSLEARILERADGELAATLHDIHVL